MTHSSLLIGAGELGGQLGTSWPLLMASGGILCPRVKVGKVHPAGATPATTPKVPFSTPVTAGGGVAGGVVCELMA